MLSLVSPSSSAPATTATLTDSPIALCLQVLNLHTTTHQPINKEAEKVEAAIRVALSDQRTEPEAIAIILKNAFDHRYVPVLNNMILQIKKADKDQTIPITDKVIEILHDEGIALTVQEDGQVEMNKSSTFCAEPQRAALMLEGLSEILPKSLIELINKEDNRQVFPKDFVVDSAGKIQFAKTSREALKKVLTDKSHSKEVRALKREIIKQVIDQGAQKFLNEIFGEINDPLNCFTRSEQGINLAHVNLSGFDLRGINFFGVDLSHANLTKVNLSNVNLVWANLERGDLSGADLSYADLSHSSLKMASLIDADLQHATMQEMYLGFATLTGANLSYINASASNFTRAKLTGAILYGITLHETNLTEVDFTNAVLSNARLDGAILDGTKLMNSNLRGANVDKASFLKNMPILINDRTMSTLSSRQQIYIKMWLRIPVIASPKAPVSATPSKIRIPVIASPKAPVSATSSEKSSLKITPSAVTSSTTPSTPACVPNSLREYGSIQ